MAFNLQAALAQINANPELSGFGSGYSEGTGENATYYSSAPVSRTGGVYSYGGKIIQPRGDGTYLVYDPVPDGKLSRLNGTYADVMDANGNVVGHEMFQKQKDAMGEGAKFLTGAAMMLPPMYMTAAGVAGAAAGAGALETASEGFGSQFENAVANGSWQMPSYAADYGTLPMETASEGFGPEFEQAVSNGTWQMPQYPANYGQLPSAELPSAPPGTPGTPGAPTDGVPPPGNPNVAPPGTPGVPPPVNPFSKADGLTNGLSSLTNGGFNWGSLIGPALSAVGGIAGAKAAGSAADAQLQATRDAAALQEPFRQGGMAAMNRLLELNGIGGNPASEGYGSAQKDFTAADFAAGMDPGYEWRKQQGQLGLERAASAKGGLGSGGYLKDAMTYNSGLASQEYGNAYNRFQTNRAAKLNPLQSLMGAGQTAANTIGGYTVDGGNAKAAGTVGQANALTSAIGQGWSMYQNQQQQYQNNALMNALLMKGI